MIEKNAQKEKELPKTLPIDYTRFRFMHALPANFLAARDTLSLIRHDRMGIAYILYCAAHKN